MVCWRAHSFPPCLFYYFAALPKAFNATDLQQHCNFYPTNVVSPVQQFTVTNASDASVQQHGFTPLWLRQMNSFSHCNLTFTFRLPARLAHDSDIKSVNVTIPHFQQFSYCNNQWALFFDEDLAVNSILAPPVSNSIQCTTAPGVWTFNLDLQKLRDRYGGLCSLASAFEMTLTLDDVVQDLNQSRGQTNVPLIPNIQLLIGYWTLNIIFNCIFELIWCAFVYVSSQAQSSATNIYHSYF